MKKIISTLRRTAYLSVAALLAFATVVIPVKTTSATSSFSVSPMGSRVTRYFEDGAPEVPKFFGGLGIARALRSVDTVDSIEEGSEDEEELADIPFVPIDYFKDGSYDGLGDYGIFGFAVYGFDSFSDLAIKVVNQDGITVLNATTPETLPYLTSAKGSGFPSEPSNLFGLINYEEGTYTVTVTNTATKQSQSLSFWSVNEVSEQTFYVKPGEDVIVDLGSMWAVDAARDSSARPSEDEEEMDEEVEIGEIKPDYNQDGNLVISTTGYAPGHHFIHLAHTFCEDDDEDGDCFGPRVLLAKVTIVVHNMEADPVDAEEVTTATISDSFEHTADMEKEAMEFYNTYGFIMYMDCRGNEECEAQKAKAAEAYSKLTESSINTVNSLARTYLTPEEAADLKTKLDELATSEDELEGIGEGIIEDVNYQKLAKTMTSVFEAVEGGDPVVTNVNVAKVTPDDETKAKILSEVEGLDIENVEFYDISITISSNGEQIGELHELSGTITVAVAEVTDTDKEGYTRQYLVILNHGTPELLSEVSKDGTEEGFFVDNGILYVRSSRFSTYAVAYRDVLLPTPISAPKTGNVTAESNSATSTLGGTIASVAVAAAIIAGVYLAKKH